MFCSKLISHRTSGVISCAQYMGIQVFHLQDSLRLCCNRKSVFDCHLKLVRRQMAIENFVSNDFYVRWSTV